MSHFEFIDNPILHKAPNAFIAHLSATSGKEALLLEHYKKLNLPDYFGGNWDALDECLKDFHWIEEQEIMIVHDDLPSLTDSDLKIYLEILNDAIKDWEQNKTHNLRVIFPTADAPHINILL